MRRVPDFDELVGGSLPPDERERLQRIHDLLVLTGPPPQLSPRTETGPTLLMRLGRSAPYRPRRGDTWVVTREHVQRDGHDASTIVLRPTT